MNYAVDNQNTSKTSCHWQIVQNWIMHGKHNLKCFVTQWMLLTQLQAHGHITKTVFMCFNVLPHAWSHRSPRNYWLSSYLNLKTGGAYGWKKKQHKNFFLWHQLAHEWSTLKHRETHGRVVSTAATDDLVLKHQIISILNAD